MPSDSEQEMEKEGGRGDEDACHESFFYLSKSCDMKVKLIAGEPLTNVCN